jgi:hypothetical protein
VARVKISRRLLVYPVNKQAEQAAMSGGHGVYQGAVSNHIPSDNRFSAPADPPGGGEVADLATQGGQFCTLYDPPGKLGRWEPVP